MHPHHRRPSMVVASQQQQQAASFHSAGGSFFAPTSEPILEAVGMQSDEEQPVTAAAYRELQQQMAQMQLRLATGTQAYNQLHAQMQQQPPAAAMPAAVAAASATVPAAVQVSSKRAPPITAPPKFQGIGGIAFDAWSREIQKAVMYYQSYGELLGEQQAVTWILNQCGDVPSQAMLDKAKQQPNFPRSRDELFTFLRTRFRPQETEVRSRLLIRTMKQGKQSVHEYTSHFQSLLTDLPDMDVKDQIFDYAQGLKPELMREVRKSAPQTLDAAINSAVLHESTGVGGAVASSAMDISNVEVGETASAAAAQPSTQSQLAAVQAQLSAMQSSGWKPGGNGGPRRERDYRTSGPYQKKRQMLDNVTPAQARERMNKGACIKCGQMGHYKDACKSTN
jgi:hypothetical protein